MPRVRPRVLHVLGSLGLGGVETWLMEMLRHRDLFSVDHEVLLTKAGPSHYEEEARRLGIPIHKLPLKCGKRAWLRSFRNFLTNKGPFAAVHSHVYLFSAPVLSEAKSAGIPIRIAHCHTARSRGDDHQTLKHSLRRKVAIRWLDRVATHRIGISDAALAEISGRDTRHNSASSVLIYGFDFSRFRGAEQRMAVLRTRLGLRHDTPIIGHVGRFEPVKNHLFLLDAFAQVLEQVPSARLVLVGEGSTREQIVAAAKAHQILDRVHFAGSTNDVPAFMRMFDVFVLPSLSEGLGIVVVEAQAAGTPAIVSDAVPREAEVVPGAVKYMPLSAGPRAWGEAMSQSLRGLEGHDDGWLEKVEQSHFALDRCIAELDAIYAAELGRR